MYGIFKLPASQNLADTSAQKFLIGTFENNLQESNGRATEEIIGDANIPAIPLISSHVLLPQAPGQRAVPVFQISHGSHEIQPSDIPKTSIAQGYHDCNSLIPSSFRSIARNIKLQQKLFIPPINTFESWNDHST